MSNCKTCGYNHRQQSPTKQCYQEQINSKNNIIDGLVEELETLNQCFQCRYGYEKVKGGDSCPGHSDGEIPCAGYEKMYDSHVCIDEALKKAKVG